MKSVRAFMVPLVILAWRSTGLAQVPDPLSLEARVTEAEVIVVGTLHPKSTMGHQTTGHIEVEQVLLGAAKTNTALAINYRTDDRFMPGAYSTTHQISPTNRYICFLTMLRAAQSATNSPLFRPVGKRALACDGFELATPPALRETEKLIAARNRKIRVVPEGSRPQLSPTPPQTAE